MNTVVIGAGYVGLVTALTLAKKSQKPVCVYELSESKRNQLVNGKAPFFEPGVDQLLKEMLDKKLVSFPHELEVFGSTAFLVCVGTPTNTNGESDLSSIRQVCLDLSSRLKACDASHVVAIKSTVPPGTTLEVVKPYFDSSIVSVAMVPEFLREGAALGDALNPDRILIGADGDFAWTTLQNVFSVYDCNNTLRCTPTEAELSKYANNSLLALFISFSNELSLLADRFPSTSVHKVLENVLLDRRWLGSDGRVPEIASYLYPGCGFGGSCFPKDVRALANLFENMNVPGPVISAILQTNEKMKTAMANRILSRLFGIRNPKVAILGLAFKPETSDTRESPALSIAKFLEERAVNVTIHDPVAELPEGLTGLKHITFTRDLKEALEGSHVCALVTSWSEYKELDEETFLKLMSRPFLLDGRGLYIKNKFSKLPYEVIGVNIKSVENRPSAISSDSLSTFAEAGQL